MSWNEVKLGEVISVKHGWAFKSQYFEDEGPYVVVTPGNFFEEGGFKLRPGKDRSYSGEFSPEYVLSEGDLIVAMTEQGPGLLGSAALIPEVGRFLHNQRIGLVSIKDQSLACLNYLYYLFNTAFVRGQLSGSATGTKVRHTAPERIYNVKVPIPDLPTQQRIASILSAYDDLIENNRRRIVLLEQAARLLYREWFIHFRFPGHETEKFVDGLPEGWTRTTFDAVCDTVGGGTPSTKNPEFWEDGDVTWVTPTDITRNDCLALLKSEKKITTEGLKHSSAKMVPSNTILMTSRASVGFFGVADFPVSTNQGFINIVPHDETMRYYLLFNLLHRVDEIRGHASGATYAEISKGKFRALPVVAPSRETLACFHSDVEKTIKQVRTIKTQNAKLTRARDLLLPRLMDGRIPV